MEGNSSGSEPLKQNGTPIHMVGGTPTVQAKLHGVDVLYVVDSGSTVSGRCLKPTCGCVKGDGQMLTLRAAYGLEIPTWNHRG